MTSTDQTTTTTTTHAEGFIVGLSTTDGETIVTLEADLLDLTEAEALADALRDAVVTAKQASMQVRADFTAADTLKLDRGRCPRHPHQEAT